MTRSVVRAAVMAASVGLMAASSGSSPTPINDLGSKLYLSQYDGGLYAGGVNGLPADHASLGTAQAGLVRPRDVNGVEDPAGNYVLLSVGMSNTAMEWCAGSPCPAVSFMAKAAADSAVNHTTLSIVNGAQGGETATRWDSPLDATYDVVRDRLVAAGLSEAQVQIVWLKQANPQPSISLPVSNADAYQLERSLGDIARALKIRYPNLHQVFLSSRIYAGYATTTLNPEPYAYQTGFSVKWVIDAQIRQERGLGLDPESGDLSAEFSPWLAWGPYLWASGRQPRKDGLKWVPSDFGPDGTHPSASGIDKVSALLLSFFKTSAQTSCWFLAGRPCT